MKQQRSLGKHGENLEGLWGELASSFTSLGGSGEATLLTYNLQPTDEFCMKRLTAIPFDTAGSAVANVAMAIHGSRVLSTTKS